MRYKKLVCPQCKTHIGIRRTFVRYRDGVGYMVTIYECENGHRWPEKERKVK